jgi:hypothetical protein
MAVPVPGAIRGISERRGVNHAPSLLKVAIAGYVYSVLPVLSGLASFCETKRKAYRVNVKKI